MNATSANFIDGGYLNAIQTGPLGLQGQRIHFDRLADLMAGGQDLLRTYYYHCAPYQVQEPSEEEKQHYASAHRFFRALRGLPKFEVRLGKLAFRGHDAAGRPLLEQKRVDTMLCVDMLKLAFVGGVTEMNLLTGDSDFVPVIQTVKDRGVRVRLFHGPRPSFHQELYEMCDERVELTLENLKDMVIHRREPALQEA